MNERSALRASAIAALSSDVSAVAGRVSAVRLFSRNTSALPAIEVATPSEQVSRLSQDGEYLRSIDLMVSVFDAGGDGIDDALDAIGVEVEASITKIAEVEALQVAMDYGAPGEKRPARMDMLFTVLIPGRLQQET